jgi:succinyl-CoA synthetase alpha subunit
MSNIWKTKPLGAYEADMKKSELKRVLGKWSLTAIGIGEIGGQLEADAAKWVKADGNRKPVVGFIAGETAPKGRTMGHAGAIVGGADDTAEAKKRIMRECGIHVVDSPAEIGKKVKEIMG